jgi:hypothetical protein
MGAAVAAWPAVALVGTYELLMMIIRSVQAPGTVTALRGVPERMQDTDPLQAQARGSGGRAPRRSGCDTRGSVGCLTEPPHRQREISADLIGY